MTEPGPRPRVLIADPIAEEGIALLEQEADIVIAPGDIDRLYERYQNVYGQR